MKAYLNELVFTKNPQDITLADIINNVEVTKPTANFVAQTIESISVDNF